jgi:hypothetical protein
MVDTQVSEACARKGVRVRVSSSAPGRPRIRLRAGFSFRSFPHFWKTPPTDSHSLFISPANIATVRWGGVSSFWIYGLFRNHRAGRWMLLVCRSCILAGAGRAGRDVRLCRRTRSCAELRVGLLRSHRPCRSREDTLRSRCYRARKFARDIFPVARSYHARSPMS